LSKFYTVTYDASDGTTLTDGEEVTWDAGEGAWVDGTDKGIVRIATSTAGGAGTVELELTTGTMPSDNDVIKGTTSGHTITRSATANARKTIDVDTNSGTNAGGYIEFIGVDSDWSGRTTRAIIDGATATDTHGVTFGAVDALWFENIEVKRIAGSTKHGWYSSASNCDGMVFVNCAGDYCSGDGWYGASGQFRYGIWIRCAAHNNTRYGIAAGDYCLIAFSSAHDNSDVGLLPGIAPTIFGTICHANLSGGAVGGNGKVINNVFDANTSKGIVGVAGTGLYTQLIALGNRITNQSGAGDYGIDTLGEITITGWNYSEANDGDNIKTSTGSLLHYPIVLEGTATTSNLEDQSDTGYGYVDQAGNDFSTHYTDATDPTLRRTAITIRWT